MECMEYALLQSCSVNLNMSKSAYMVMLVRQIRWKFVRLLYHQWAFYIATFKKKKNLIPQMYFIFLQSTKQWLIPP